MISKEELLNTNGDFTWSFGDLFFIELHTEQGNFVWSDPDYNGDNSIHPFDGDCIAWCKALKIPFGRSKGSHLILGYVGPDVVLHKEPWDPKS